MSDASDLYANFAFPDQTYEPSPQFLNIPHQKHIEASPGILRTFYWLVLFFSLVSIVSGSGQFYTHYQCSQFPDEAHIWGILFDVFAGLSILLGAIAFGFSVYALFTDMGISKKVSYEPRQNPQMQLAMAPRGVSFEVTPELAQALHIAPDYPNTYQKLVD